MTIVALRNLAQAAARLSPAGTGDALRAGAVLGAGRVTCG
jgi:hypothetical protein